MPVGLLVGTRPFEQNALVERLGGGVDSRLDAVVGRELEFAVIQRFLAPEGELRSLALVGEPGIGKTTLWEAAVVLALERGVRVLRTRASEAEARLPFAGLADLLDGVDDEALAGLPAPQRRALEIALGREAPRGAPPEQLAISSGFLGALRSLARRGPLVVAVDDVQWIDARSGDVLVFAARRLADEPVRFLLSQRTGRPSALEQVFAATAGERLEVTALSFGAINRLLLERLSQPLPRRAARQVFGAAEGNPLMALELGRTLVERGIPAIGAELPLPDLLDDLFTARVDALSTPVRSVLLAIALSAGLSRAELAAVVDPLALEDAQASGLFVVERSRLRPSHPLLAASVVRGSSARERRDLHLRLADAVADPTLRARHLALATAAPDAELAARLATAARVASERGAVEDAVELAAHALRLTQTDAVEYSRRLVELAEYLHVTGDLPRANELLRTAIETLPAGAERAAAHLLLGEGEEDALEHECIERAVAESADDPGLHARALARRALRLAIASVERLGEAEASALEALPAARAAGTEVEERVSVALAWARTMRGRPVDDLRRRLPAIPVRASLYEGSIDRPAGVRLAFRGETEQARAIFGRLLALAEERGEERSGAVFNVQLCELALRVGDTVEAARLLGEWKYWIVLEREADTQIGLDRLEAVLAAVVGDPEGARRSIAAVLAATESRSGFGWDRLEAVRASGITELFEHETARAVVELRAVWEHTVTEGVDDPGAFPVAPDLVEALVGCGEFSAANEVSERLSLLASEQRHPWGTASAKRCRATIELAAGYRADAAVALADAAASYGELGLGFDRARSLLLLGKVQRRAQKRADARRSLEDAEAAFAQGGSRGWVEQARSELARVSGRRSPKEGVLSPSEHAVAELAAGGLTNKEIAAQRFISVYTVEAHLKSAYAKLGIRSRSRLAGRIGDR